MPKQVISRQFIEDLLSRVSLVDIIGKRVKLKRSGANYQGLCPFHQEKTPSFSVNDSKQFYYCFGCGAGGDAIDFLQSYERMEFVEVIEELAKQAGVTVPVETDTHQQAQLQAKQQAIKEQVGLLEQAREYFIAQLASHPDRGRVNHYIKRRGLTPEICQRFGLGYAPSGWDNLTQAFASDTDVMLETGLIIRNEEKNRIYDRFRDRLMFPIRDARGRTIAFGGRVLGDDKPKYLNSPETETFQKGRELYGLYEARQSRQSLNKLLVVEGYMDVIGLAQAGIHYAVATLGTATSGYHIERIFKQVDQLVFCFDGDAAGRRAAGKAMDVLLPVIEDGKSARFLFLPEGEDPDSLVRQEGKEAFEARVAEAQPSTDFFFKQVGADIDTHSIDGRAQLGKLAYPLLLQMQPGLMQQMMLKRLSELTGLELEQIQSVLNLDESLASSAQPEVGEPSQQPPLAIQPDYSAADFVATTAPKALTHRVISLALHSPSVAKGINDEQLATLAELPFADTQLLVRLLTYLKERPDVSLGELLVDWQYNASYQPLLPLLNQAVFDPLHTGEIEKQFDEALQRLLARSTDSKIDLLTRKSQQGKLSAAEKQELSKLLLQHKY